MKRTLHLSASILSFSLLMSSSALSQWVATNSPTVSPVVCFTSIGSNLFAGTAGGGVFISTDNGSNWTACNTGLIQQEVHALASIGQNLFAGTTTGDFRSTDSGKSWSKGLIDKGILAFVVNGTDLFVGADEGGVARSTDLGHTWTPLIPGIPSQVVVAGLAVLGTDLFAATLGDGVYRSIDNGNNWTAADTGISNMAVYRLLTHGPNLIAGTIGAGLFLSTDKGSNWSAINSGIMEDSVLTIASSGTNLFAGIFHRGVFVSTDEGSSWTQANEGTPVANPSVYALYVNGTNLLAGTSGFTTIWRRPLPELIGHSVVSKPAVARYNIHSYPNPFISSTQITISLELRTYTEISILNLLGIEVARIFSGELEAGEHNFEWVIERNARPTQGVYECVVRMNGQLETLPVLLLR